MQHAQGEQSLRLVDSLGDRQTLTNIVFCFGQLIAFDGKRSQIC